MDNLSGRFKVSIVLIFCVLCITSLLNVGENKVSSFAADSSGLIYVAAEDTIEVYQNLEHIRSISIPSGYRSFYFTICEDDTILLVKLSQSKTVYIMDLNGNVLDSWEESNLDTFYKVYHKKEYVSVSGDTYKIKGNWLLPKIVKNGEEIVYRVSVLTALVYHIRNICWGLFVVVIFWELSDFLRNQRRRCR